MTLDRHQRPRADVVAVVPPVAERVGERPPQPVVTRRPAKPATQGRRAAGRRLRFLAAGPWPLLAILAVQASLSLRLIWSNTAFNDEALYLWSGHWEIAHLLYGTEIPQFQTYFSGAPVIYPVIGAVVDSYGGLAAARLLSLAFMLGATLLCYLTARRLFGHRAGLIAAALFAVLGPVQFLGAFATYDAMALFLLAASACLVVHARGRWSEPALILAAAVLALADATKYATGLWNPVVIMLAGLTAASGIWWRDLLRALRFAGYLAVLVLAAVRAGGHLYVQGLLFTTLARAASSTPVMAVIRDTAIWIGVLVILAARSVVIAQNGRARLLSAVLVAAALLAPIEQARLHQGTSLQKHVAFGAWFAAIAAGLVLGDALRRSKYAHWRLPAAALAAVGALGILAAPVLYGAWPDSRPAVNAIARAAARSPGEVLSEQGVVADYYLHLAPSQLTNTFAKIDYVRDIHQHVFAVVEVDGTFARRQTLDNALVAAVSSVPGYRLVAEIPWTSSRGHGAFRIWRYVGGSR
jgi:4-amino-4-deoxy-L-arabinose transferase-like glycosyltransferase